MGKTIEPISVPNDGPLKAVLPKNDDSKDLIQSDIGTGIPETLRLLKNQDTNGAILELEVKTIKDLQGASSLRDQLSSLRAYRSSILNLQNDDCNDGSIAKPVPNDNHIGMYRFLLEFGFSENTPHALKRASESCLSALSSSTFGSDDASVYDEINQAVVRSVLDPTFGFTTCWSDPIQTVFDILSFGPTLFIVLNCKKFIAAILGLLMSEGHAIEDILKDHYHSNHEQQKQGSANERDGINTVGVVNVNVLQAIEKGVEICTTLKLFLAVKNQGQMIPSSSDIKFDEKLKMLLTRLLQHIVIPLVRCKATSSDSLFVCSVAFAQVLLLWWKLERGNNYDIAEKAGDLVSAVVCRDSKDKFDDTGINISNMLVCLPQLNQVAIVKGLVATLPDNILSKSADENNNDLLLVVEQIAAFILHVANVSTENGARLLALKGLETVMGRWKTILTIQKGGLSERARKLSNQVLYVALATWESPPTKQIGCAVPGVFQSLVKILGVLDSSDSNAGEEKSIEILVGRVLSQPSSRKGKYVALEALLPKVGAKKMIMLAKSEVGGSSTTLVSSFIDEIGRRRNTSGAVAELLAKMLSMLRIEMHRDAGVDLCQHQEGNKKERKKKEKLLRLKATEIDGSCVKEEILLLDDWNKVWAPTLADALLKSDASFRNQVASFCLPLLVTFVGGKGNRIDASHAFAILLNEIRSKDECATRAEESNEALIWAKFEVVRHANLSKLLKLNSSSAILKKAVSQALPLDLLQSTLFHEASRLRLTAFQSIEPILFTYDDSNTDPVHYLLLEISMWKQALPYAFKCSDKEYVVTLTQTLRPFLDRISDQETNSDGPLLLSFVIDFLLQDLFVKQAAYPGTVADKEKWALSMIDCIVSFATQHKSSLSGQKKPSKHSSIRKVSSNQQKLYEQILENILSESVLSTLIALMNSMWDSTRSCAHEIILEILQYAKEDKIRLPDFLSNKKSIDLFQARAIHLASSPRQREADTGARMISLICATMNTPEEQLAYLEMLSDLLLKRIVMMELSLGIFVGERTNSFAKNSDELPLAHGLIQSVRLIVETCSLSHVLNGKEVYESMIKTCFRAIEVSLVVVADVKHTDEVEETAKNNGSSQDQDRWKIARAKQATNVPLNVNTSAIGANASFASLDLVDDNEKKMRLLTQRIIMGTWLLIKEACSALSSIMGSSAVKDLEQLTNAGNLLISTLTSLKHQGAAFAAHKALQRLSSICYSSTSCSTKSEIRLLPSNWSEKLLYEITSTEIVRDSTLRRSSGYGLGFLSILRSEQNSPRFLFPYVLGNLLMISLPPSSVMKKQMKRWNVSEQEMFVFSKTVSSSRYGCFVSDDNYEERSRIHALNILRLIILDAPLATEMREFVGDSIIASLIGYTDSSWAIRNSATMCFAAAMIRVVDADKNADMVYAKTNSTRTTNAVTCKELFRSYPPLATTLLSLIKEENSPVHPVLFPLLLLLARLQPLSRQRNQSGDDTISKLFIDPIINCLGHVHHKVRLVAARALAVLCSGDHERGAILAKCIEKLSFNNTTEIARTSHNLDHGVLLAVKYLLGSSTDPHEYLDKSVLDAIIYYSTWCNFELLCPPSCTAIALEVWQIAALMDLRSTMRPPLLATAFKVVRSVEEVSTRDSGKATIGLSDLAKIASKCACKIAFSYIFDASTSVEARMRYTEIVEHCFTSENYDIMLYSVKAFKKGIYDAVDNIVADDENLLSTNMNILETVSKLAIRCISSIFSRDKFEAHPPTLRRLSRIALESIYALKYMNVTGVTLVTHLIDFSADDLWKMCLYLLRVGGYSMNEKEMLNKEENLSGGNALAGNALQLTSFVIYEMFLHQDTAAPLSSHLSRSIELFVYLVRQSIHPLSSWKIRHSAAISVKESGLVHTSKTAYSKMMYTELIQLFQDSDDDVRYEAGRAIFTSRKLPTVSLKHLELASSKLSSDFSTIDMFNRILGRLGNLCTSVESKLATATREYNYTVHSPAPNSILNLCTARKIFEEEDPNPYLEVLVIMHAEIFSLSGFPADFVINNERTASLFGDVYKTSLRLLNNMAELLRETNGCIDLAHNLSFDVNIFPYFHGSILGTAFGFWLGIEDKAIVDAARDVLGMQSSVIHPCIAQALRLLISVEKGDAKSKSEILQCCFLLPMIEV